MNNLSIINYNVKTWVEQFPAFKIKLDEDTVHASWKEYFQKDTVQEQLKKINEFLTYCFTTSNGTVKIFPYPELIFNALNATPLPNIKVIILGQDPYFNCFETNNKIVPQAMGLSFSVPNGIKVPPSLDNIYNNLLKFKHISKKPSHGNLSFWAYQGCLMLNTTLTVQEKCPNSHESKWTDITDELIYYISENTENNVFVLWGAPSLKKLKLINTDKHKVIVSSHPSPLSCRSKLRNYNSFEETDHFGDINKYLTEHNKSTILWQLA